MDMFPDKDFKQIKKYILHLNDAEIDIYNYYY